MKSFFEKSNRFLELPLDLGPRGLLVVAVLLLVPSYLFPLWTLTMFAPQYGDGLRMQIYSWRLDGGNGGQDIKEINVLNHYIGMRDLTTADFTEFKWIPFVVGILAPPHAADRRPREDVAPRGQRRPLSLLRRVLALVVRVQALDATATTSRRPPPSRSTPFMPPMFGYKKLANFEVYSYPGLGSYALGLVAVVLVGAMFARLARGQARARARAPAPHDRAAPRPPPADHRRHGAGDAGRARGAAARGGGVPAAGARGPGGAGRNGRRRPGNVRGRSRPRPPRSSRGPGAAAARRVREGKRRARARGRRDSRGLRHRRREGRRPRQGLLGRPHRRPERRRARLPHPGRALRHLPPAGGRRARGSAAASAASTARIRARRAPASTSGTRKGSRSKTT